MRVGVDYHVEGDEHYYSVPYRLARLQLQLRMTVTTVEVFHRGQRVAAHLRSPIKNHHTTLDAHMPRNTKPLPVGMARGCSTVHRRLVTPLNPWFGSCWERAVSTTKLSRLPRRTGAGQGLWQ